MCLSRRILSSGAALDEIFVFFTGDEVSDEITQAIIEEVQGQKFPDRITTGYLYGVNIVPAILIQLIVDHGIAKYESHLTASHARLKLVDHLLGDDVALLNRDPVNAREAQVRAAGQNSDGKNNDCELGKSS